MGNLSDPYFQWGEYCSVCKRWFNPTTGHQCVVGDPDVVKERKKLVRWLGEYEIIE